MVSCSSAAVEKWTEEDKTKIMRNRKYHTDSVTYLEERWAHRPSSLPPPKNPQYNVNELVMKQRGKARKKSAAETTCSSLFGDAIYHINKNPETKLRGPAEMPLESDTEKVKDYTVSRMKALVDDEYLHWTKHEHIELHDLAASRLTLLNAQHGGEPARLAIMNWLDAKSAVWLSQDRLSNIPEPDRSLFAELKIM